ncbi:hypothetical protein [Haloferula sargassicola]|uniref:Secreted protein n=1 Tax=Haloferula sargassicola TaxID=490096 RepID=A0ABP9UX58_9BACT
MKAAIHILLVLLLFCSQGRSVCFDQSGGSYFCEPAIFAHGDDHGTPCHCPCNDDDCEEHELRLDPVLADSVKVPSQPCIILPFEFATLFDAEDSILSESQATKRLPTLDDPDPAFRLRKDLMTGVVLRL